ncbi:MFS transporter [Falsiroseomonas sp.]|uniref:MFS transporter n=1 Tax=Falsiroseomonas sp. TaxID=2870721 RepID=UPI003F6EBCF8
MTGTVTRAEADRASRHASIVLGLTLPGDTVLYLLLPLHAAAFGVSLAEAGLLLAANRLVRIAGYGWVARFYERSGPRQACLCAVLGAACATAGYAVLPGVWWLLPARLLWGLSFAAMNIATQALATAEATGAARRSGTSRAIIATGPMLGLLAGAVVAELVGPRVVFLGLGLLSLGALPFAWRLPAGEGARLRSGGPRFALPRPLDLWSFIQGLTLDGLFVLGLAFLAAAALPQGAALAAGAALSARYLAEVLLGPSAGRMAERLGAAPLLLWVSLGSAAGLVVIGAGWLWVGSLLVVGLRGLLQPLPAPVAAARAPAAERVAALARLATWRDIGAGLGPLVAGVLLPLVPALWLYLGAAALLVAASLAALRR